MNANSQRSDTCLTISQIALRLCVSERTVRRWTSDGELHFHQLGRAVRVREGDLDAFLSARRR